MAAATYDSPALWEQRNAAEASSEQHVDWLCAYPTLLPLIAPILERPRCSALLLGAGVSRFPEDLYDAGVREVMCVDLTQAATAAVAQRNAEGGRRGLRCLQADVSAPDLALPGPQGPGYTSSYDLAIDKGVLDCVLAMRDGNVRAANALRNVYNALKTPGTFILVSHSCPAERLALLQSVYWHGMQVKRVQATPWDKLASEEQYAEELVDWEGGPPVPFEPGSAFVYVLEK